MSGLKLNLQNFIINVYPFCKIAFYLYYHY